MKLNTDLKSQPTIPLVLCFMKESKLYFNRLNSQFHSTNGGTPRDLTLVEESCSTSQRFLVPMEGSTIHRIEPKDFLLRAIHSVLEREV